MLKRIRTDQYARGDHLHVQEFAFVMDTRLHDIPNTVRGFIRALPWNCVAVSLRLQGGFSMVKVAEREARRAGVRILWV